jgi:hypothetical protein
MATETAGLAQTCGDPSVAEAYMAMATVWVKMAEEARTRALPDEGADLRSDPDDAGAGEGPTAA